MDEQLRYFINAGYINSIDKEDMCTTLHLKELVDVLNTPGLKEALMDTYTIGAVIGERMQERRSRKKQVPQPIESTEEPFASPM